MRERRMLRLGKKNQKKTEREGQLTIVILELVLKMKIKRIRTWPGELTWGGTRREFQLGPLIYGAYVWLFVWQSRATSTLLNKYIQVLFVYIHQ